MSISYELALKLKEMGFPFRKADTMTPSENVFLYPFDGAHYWVYPTLSEIIYACGYNFQALTLDNWTGNLIVSGARKDPEGWIACNRNVTLDGEPDPIIGKGLTPIEAVANLWLELNKGMKLSDVKPTFLGK